MTVTKAVILAAGLGSRMRRADDSAQLTSEQERAAQAGVKAMISVGRPFLDHVITALADAGITDICLVIGPSHDVIREYYEQVEKSRVRIHFAIQQTPLGTADAVAAAREFCGSDRFVAINSDNYYPAPELGQLVTLPGCGALGFDPEALVSKGNIAADRVSAYAVMTREAGKLAQIIEKPDPKTLASLGEVLVSMNCWLFDASIFTAISQIDKSARGEYEIVDAVRQAISDGNPFDVVPVHSACLDLSNRGDIASVAAALESHEVRL